jgi:hypothetical protein
MNSDDIDKMMAEYNGMHIIDQPAYYYEKDYSGEVNHELYAKLINANVHKMNTEEQKLMLGKLFSPERIRYELLRYELKYYKDEIVINTFDEFLIATKSILDRYQGKAGGLVMEDNDWGMHTSKSEKYALLRDEVVFDNSIKQLNMNDYETLFYLKMLVNRLKCLSNKVIVKYKLANDKDNKICWVIIKIKNNFSE